MPPKRRADEETSAAGGAAPAANKRVAAAPGAGAGPSSATSAAAVRSGAPAGTRTGVMRAAPKPGVRKVGAATAQARAKAAVPGAGVVSMGMKKEPPKPAVVTRNVLMWFRTDLRLKDNHALHAASVRSKVGNRNLIALFIVSEKEWEQHDEAPIKIDFWMRNLAKLKESLDKLAIPLVIKRAETPESVTSIVEGVVKDMDISHVFWNAELMVDERRRDRRVKRALLALPNTVVEECDDQCVIPPKEIATKTGNPYSVFTPFRNTWSTMVETNPHFLELSDEPTANPDEAKKLYADIFASSAPNSHPHNLDAELMEELYPAGEETAHLRLKDFLAEKAKQYHETRDFPYENGCSSLSPYLSAGVLSTRQCIAAARAANNNKIMVGNDGLRTWIKELIWREFYRNILVHFPRVCMNKPFQPITEHIRWTADQRRFQMWSQGKTGYPIVDAGMRQLNTIGYMHNRVRMIVACFLVKDLFVNWQKGEKYFMNNLIDGDLASNNGGWQWCASTGTDAQPYFRIFNPVLQSQRFDPNGDYIRKWVPELKHLNEKQIHDPYHTLSAKDFAKLGYSKPIVDHADSKKKFQDEFKRIIAEHST
ncbi:hypothetical protein DFQ27_008783 [Actinomortierella ambigua]|uniref:Photolyase/cryptochrome alpha/beta domain-containing protein n=1 Tax=Actinomortierella ambigua TaxID=1343610 RepID=A0A9P6PRM6_9FUNG|nr:hypothetical protein DFQ27_008783 [Actinomortierella ambigua]